MSQTKMPENMSQTKMQSKPCQIHSPCTVKIFILIHTFLLHLSQCEYGSSIILFFLSSRVPFPIFVDTPQIPEAPPKSTVLSRCLLSSWLTPYVTPSPLPIPARRLATTSGVPIILCRVCPSPRRRLVVYGDNGRRINHMWIIC